MFPATLTTKCHEILKLLKKRQLRLVTAESCTGGLISAAITEIPGASSVFERGYITYSNEAKIELLTVPTFFIEEYGSVSLEVAIAMAEGALLMSKADIGISITGCAGPDGGSETKPVGTVFIGLAAKGVDTICERFHFTGSRHQIRLASTEAALNLIIKQLS